MRLVEGKNFRYCEALSYLRGGSILICDSYKFDSYKFATPVSSVNEKEQAKLDKQDAGVAELANCCYTRNGVYVWTLLLQAQRM